MIVNNMATKIDIVRWQCSESCIYFSEILNIIEDLNKDSENVRRESIEEIIRSIQDGYEKDKVQKMDGILEYADHVEYVRKENDFFKINNKIENKRCSQLRDCPVQGRGFQSR